MLSSLPPKAVWQIFSEICEIPRPSHHEEKITKYVLDLAKKHKISAQQDKTGNILLRKKATSGMEHCPSIVLQAHLDMVTQKNEGTEHDFLVDPIQAYVDGNWVKAKGTTLGADNGIGLASTLAVLADNSIEHGPIEVLLTTGEETGMVGAFGLQPDWLKSKYLINTDSENEGEIFIGCAGGVNVKQSMPITRTAIPKQHDMVVQLAIKGLKGGHSGLDINLGRGNAIKLLIRFLADYASNIDIRLADFKGGSFDSAIPREAFAIITLNSASYAKLKTVMEEYETSLKNEYSHTEPTLTLTQEAIEQSNITDVISYQHQKNMIDWLNVAPHGIIQMSNDFKGVVESSLNLAIAKIENNQIVAQYLVRSLIDSTKNGVISMLISLSRLGNLSYEISGNFPGWQPDDQSPLLNLVKVKYNELFSAKAKVKVIHAGLECGLFKTSYPNVDMVSIGPTIVYPHSPDEKVDINSVSRYWNLLLTLLKSAGELK